MRYHYKKFKKSSKAFEDLAYSYIKDGKENINDMPQKLQLYEKAIGTMTLLLFV